MIFPAVTVLTTVMALVFLGMLLMVTGIATIIGAFCAGQWSGLLLHVLAGVFYLVLGFLIADAPAVARAWSRCCWRRASSCWACFASSRR